MTKGKDLERYTTLLFAKRDELWARGVTLPPAGGTKGDIMDVASADVEADLQVRFREADRLVLKEIEDALGRIRAGSFGVCEACSQPIAKARLDVVPWARFCRDCGERERA
ncbi:MAG: TraR/DksA C4-type zinc finger protein [Acidobacteriia bacterium]|nr:TraR/DksA C4-type zinc finger protein [Terriglobia bacterium]